jgi:hypothetical protein
VELVLQLLRLLVLVQAVEHLLLAGTEHHLLEVLVGMEQHLLFQELLCLMRGVAEVEIMTIQEHQVAQVAVGLAALEVQT